MQSLIPAEDRPFIIKARHWVFYGTSLGYLLRQAGVERVVRRFQIAVVPDAVAGIDPEPARCALTMMERNMRAHLVSSADVLR